MLGLIVLKIQARRWNLTRCFTQELTKPGTGLYVSVSVIVWIPRLRPQLRNSIPFKRGKLCGGGRKLFKVIGTGRRNARPKQQPTPHLLVGGALYRYCSIYWKENIFVLENRSLQNKVCSSFSFSVEGRRRWQDCLSNCLRMSLKGRKTVYFNKIVP